MDVLYIIYSTMHTHSPECICSGYNCNVFVRFLQKFNWKDCFANIYIVIVLPLFYETRWHHKLQFFSAFIFVIFGLFLFLTKQWSWVSVSFFTFYLVPLAYNCCCWCCLPLPLFAVTANIHIASDFQSFLIMISLQLCARCNRIGENFKMEKKNCC